MLRAATRRPLLDPARLRAVAELNLGAARRLDDYFAFHSRLRRVSLAALGSPPPEGAEWEAGITMSRHGVEVELGARRSAAALELSLDGNDGYAVELLREGRQVWRDTLTPRGAGLTRCRLDLPEGIGEAGFDAVRVIPLEGDRRYGLGALRLVAAP